MDVKIVQCPDNAEYVTEEVLKLVESFRFTFNPSHRLRAVYCPKCGLHYTVVKPREMQWAPAVVHMICKDCGGNGWPLTLAAPR